MDLKSRIDVALETGGWHTAAVLEYQALLRECRDLAERLERAERALNDAYTALSTQFAFEDRVDNAKEIIANAANAAARKDPAT